MEKTLATQKLEISEMKILYCTLYDELQDSKKHNVMLEQHITQMKSTAKLYEEEIIEIFMKQSCEESKKRQGIEMDLLSAIQRVSTLLYSLNQEMRDTKHKNIFSQVKEAENSYQNEKTQRESLEDKVARQRLEIEEIKKWRDELFYELQDVKEQKLKLERVVSMNVLNSVYRLKWSRVTN
jgi:hypothetical protein